MSPIIKVSQQQCVGAATAPPHLHLASLGNIMVTFFFLTRPMLLAPHVCTVKNQYKDPKHLLLNAVPPDAISRSKTRKPAQLACNSLILMLSAINSDIHTSFPFFLRFPPPIMLLCALRSPVAMETDKQNGVIQAECPPNYRSHKAASMRFSLH